MTETGRWLIFMGFVLALAGAALLWLGRTGYRGLPGDLHLESEHLRLYLPLGTCLALSALLSLFLWLWQMFIRR